MLHANRYKGPQAAVIIQSFEVSNLQGLAGMTKVRLAQLINCSGRPYDFTAAGDPRTYADLVTPAGLAFVAGYADGIGACKDVLIPRNADGTLASPSPVIATPTPPAWSCTAGPSAGRTASCRSTSAGAPTSTALIGEIRAFLVAGMDGVLHRQPRPRSRGRGPPPRPPGPTVDVQLLAINDFHGNLEPAGRGRLSARHPVPRAGGAVPGHPHPPARATNPNTLVVVGRRPDRREPAAVGAFPRRAHHRGDERAGPRPECSRQPRVRRGRARAAAHAERRLPPADGCLDGDGFAGADFEFLAANVVRAGNREALFPPYEIRSFHGDRIGVHRHDPGGHPRHRHPVRGHRARLPRRGGHGQRTGPRAADAGRRDDRRAAARRWLADRRLQRLPRHLRPDRRDRQPHATTTSTWFVTGHTHQAYNCVIDGRLVTSAHLRAARHRHRHAAIDLVAGDVSRPSRRRHIVTTIDVPRPADTPLIASTPLSPRPSRNRVIGRSPPTSPAGPPRPASRRSAT